MIVEPYIEQYKKEGLGENENVTPNQQTKETAPKVASPLTREETRVLNKPGWLRSAKDLVTLDKLAQKHPDPAAKAPEAPFMSPESTVATTPTIEVTSPLPENDRDEVRMENLKNRGMFTEQFAEVDRQRTLQDRANRIQLEGEEAQELNSFKERMHHLEEGRDAGRSMTGNDQVELDYYHQKFQPEVATESADQTGIDVGVKQLRELKNKPGFQKTAEDRTNEKVLEEKYGAELDRAEAADQETATRAVEASRRLESAAETARIATETARVQDPLASVEPNQNQEDLDAVKAFNDVINPLRQRANGFGEPLSPEEHARLDRLEAAYRQPAAPVEPKTHTATTETTNIVDRLMELPDDDFMDYISGLDDKQTQTLLDQMTNEQYAQFSTRVEGLTTSPAEEDLSPLPVETVGEPPEMNPNEPEVGETEDEKAAREAEQAERATTVPLPATETPDEKAAREARERADQETLGAEIARDTEEKLAADMAQGLQTPTEAERARQESLGAQMARATEEEIAAGMAEGLPTPPEASKNFAQKFLDTLRSKSAEYKDHPGRLLTDGSHLLEDAARAWWKGVMPVNFYEGPTAGHMIKTGEGTVGEYLHNWKWLNMAFYTGGVALGATVDVVAFFPGLGGLRTAVRLAAAGAIPAGLGASEVAERRFILNDIGLTPEEKIEKIAQSHERHTKAHERAANTAHGIAAGMVMGNIVHALGIDKATDKIIDGWFKPKVVAPVTTPPVSTTVVPGIAGPEVTPTPAGEITFKAVEDTGFQGADISKLAVLGNVKDWGLTPGQGMEKTKLIQWAIRQGARTFGRTDQVVSYDNLPTNTKNLITLLLNSDTQQKFLDAGGRAAINLVNTNP